MGRAGVHYLAHTIICSDLIIKGITLEVQELLLDVLVVAVHPSMLWGCSSASAWGEGGGRGGVPCASQQWNFSWLVSACIRVNQVNYN